MNGSARTAPNKAERLVPYRPCESVRGITVNAIPSKLTSVTIETACCCFRANSKLELEPEIALTMPNMESTLNSGVITNH